MTAVSHIQKTAQLSFARIAPFWPLKNLIAVNPLQGLEHLPIEDALHEGAAYFQADDIPAEMEVVNRETIKWLQVFFDDGQATLPMPLRARGLYAAWRELALYDCNLYANDTDKRLWLGALPSSPEEAIDAALKRLDVTAELTERFLTLLLTTLPGWAAYVKYRTEWAGLDTNHPHPVTQADYLAVRLVITSLLWPDAKTLLEWHAAALAQPQKPILDTMEQTEAAYRQPLLKMLAAQPLQEPRTPDAQLVFCIDVRSEPFRRALEGTGDYHTLGFAGFFGVPVQITNGTTGESHASCPVLLTPKHEVTESPCGQTACQLDHVGYERVTGFKRVYQSAKYTFTAPFALAEGLGAFSGIWMGLRSLTPGLVAQLKRMTVGALRQAQAVEPSLETIPFSEQCAYAEGALRMMGLTGHFAPTVVFCGHGSSTQNNAYATALDCGACGGRHGASNARILAAILNRGEVRAFLARQGIAIPETTRFVAAEHNTTTDEVSLYDDVPETLKSALAKARKINSVARLTALQASNTHADSSWLRAQDWAQVRPEWGLAGNAAFIIAPRDLTRNIDLQGRCFLHSYDHAQDADGSALTTILTAPMVVAEWINTQYLFSTLDNVAYGGGSKITKNITGKIGIMQGNASDLMTGLPLQSVYADDHTPYHTPQRLLSVVYASREKLDAIIETQPVLQKLFGNGWVQLACVEPDTHAAYMLKRDLKWQSAN